MNYTTVKKTLKGRLKRFSSSTSLDEWINLELNNMMEELEEEGFIPWFLFARDDALVLTAGTYKRALPDNFLRERLIDSEDSHDSFGKILDTSADRWQPLRLAQEHPLYSGEITATASATAKPSAYYVDSVEEELVFNAWADADYTFCLDYVRSSTRYTDDPQAAEEPHWAKWAPGYLIAVVGLRLSTQYLKNDASAQMFLGDVSRERIKLIHKHTAVLESKLNPNSEN